MTIDKALIEDHLKNSKGTDFRSLNKKRDARDNVVLTNCT